MKGFALKLIKEALFDSPKTREQLLKITKLPERTLRYNLSILKKQKFVKEMKNLKDLRKKVFLLNIGSGGRTRLCTSKKEQNRLQSGRSGFKWPCA